MKPIKGISTALFLLLFWLPAIARAELGGGVGGLQNEARSFHVADASSSRKGYEMHELALGKYVLHQFVGPDRTVFGVAWSGRAFPDFSALMGSHLGQFKAALSQGRAGRHGRFPVNVETGNLHLEISSHGMSASGRAWLIDRVPAGVDLNELR